MNVHRLPSNILFLISESSLFDLVKRYSITPRKGIVIKQQDSKDAERFSSVADKTGCVVTSIVTQRSRNSPNVGLDVSTISTKNVRLSMTGNR